MNDQEKTLAEVLSEGDAGLLTDAAKSYSQTKVQDIMNHRASEDVTTADVGSVMNVAKARANRGESLFTYPVDVSAHIDEAVERHEQIKFVSY